MAVDGQAVQVLTAVFAADYLQAVDDSGFGVLASVDLYSPVAVFPGDEH